MPFKDEKKRRDYQKKKKRQYRKEKRHQRKQAQEELLSVFSPIQIRKELPNVATLIFGKAFDKLTDETVKALLQKSEEFKVTKKTLKRLQKRQQRKKQGHSIPLY